MRNTVALNYAKKSAHFSEECGMHHANGNMRCTPEVRHL